MIRGIYRHFATSQSFLALLALVAFSLPASSQPLNQATKPQISLQVGHDLGADKIAVSPNGKWLASGDGIGTVKVWNLQNGDLCWTLDEVGNSVESLVFSPDSQLLATGRGSEGVKLWNVDSGRLVRTVYPREEAESRLASPVAFSSNGQSLWIATKNHLQSRSTKTGKRERQFEIYGRLLAVSPSANFAVTVDGDGALLLWNISTGKLQRTLSKEKPYEGHPTITAAAFTADGKRLATGRYDGKVVLWDIPTGEKLSLQGIELHTLQRETFGDLPTDSKSLSKLAVTSLAFSKNGRVLAIGVGDHPEFESRGLQALAAGSVIEYESGEKTTYNLVPRGDTVQAVGITPDGKTLVSADDEATIRLWNRETRGITQTLARHVDDPYWAVFSGDNSTLVTVGERQPAIVWDLKTGRYSGLLQNKTDAERPQSPLSYLPPPSVFRFAPDGRTLVTGNYGGEIQIWDAKNLQLLSNSYGSAHRITALAFSSDGRMLASGSEDGSVRLWQIPTAVSSNGKLPAYKLLRTFRVSSEEFMEILGLAFLPDNKTLACLPNFEPMQIWDINARKITRKLSIIGDDNTEGTFSPDGRYYATHGLKSTELWNLTSGKLERKLPTTEEWVENLTFSPDGNSLATNVSNVIGEQTDSPLRQVGMEQAQLKIWDVKTGVLKKVIRHWPGDAYSASFSSDGKLMAVCTREKTTQLWDVVNGRMLATLAMLPSSEDLKYSKDWIIYTPTGEYSASANANQFLRWRVGNQLFPASKFESTYRRPDIIQQVLSEKSVVPLKAH